MATNFSNSNISSIQLSGKKYNLKSIPFHATEDEWKSGALASYIPKQGEIVVYDIDGTYDYERIKVGDGVTVIGNLAFYLASELDYVLGKLEALENAVDVEIDKNLNMLVFTRPLSI